MFNKLMKMNSQRRCDLWKENMILRSMWLMYVLLVESLTNDILIGYIFFLFPEQQSTYQSWYLLFLICSLMKTIKLSNLYVAYTFNVFEWTYIIVPLVVNIIWQVWAHRFEDARTVQDVCHNEEASLTLISQDRSVFNGGWRLFSIPS